MLRTAFSVSQIVGIAQDFLTLRQTYLVSKTKLSDTDIKEMDLFSNKYQASLRKKVSTGDDQKDNSYSTIVPKAFQHKDLRHR